jgi:putative colanic acid biosynthesis acetyltransferase WcaF
MSSKHVVNLVNAASGALVGRPSKLIEALWMVVETTVLMNRLLPFTGVRVFVLRLFGATVGRNCRLLHPIRVKYPHNLTLGDSCWLGEDVWIFNQAPIVVGSNVCISQGTFITTGSHDLGNMDLRISPVYIEDGVWISSRCVVQMGVTIGQSAVVTPNSVVHKDLAGDGIYGGNPCQYLTSRFPSGRTS